VLIGNLYYKGNSYLLGHLIALLKSKASALPALIILNKSFIALYLTIVLLIA
jgi:hypothetical protein